VRNRSILGNGDLKIEIALIGLAPSPPPSKKNQKLKVRAVSE